ncbi:hypothetical protein CRYUN_Cryun07bG0107200 [Craigia yunnanensis]
MSGVVTKTASFAGVIAVINPASIPAGQSISMKSGDPSSRAFRASTSQTNAFPPNPMGSFDLGFEMQSNSKFDQRLSRTNAWSSRQSPLSTSTTVTEEMGVDFDLEQGFGGFRDLGFKRGLNEGFRKGGLGSKRVPLVTTLLFWLPVFVNTKRRGGGPFFPLNILDKGRPCELFELDYGYQLFDGDKLIGSLSVHKMGKCKGCGKLGRMLPRDGPVNAYHSALLCSPVVSVWDCIVRKMRYSYRPEWV